MYRLRWWWFLFVNVVALGGLAAFDLLQTMWHADATHLGAAILLMYAGWTAWVGRLTCKPRA